MSESKIESFVKIKAILLKSEKLFRIRFVYDGLNETLTSPFYLYDMIKKGIGPLVDFVDSFPPQLVYFPNDKDTFLEEAKMSFEGHRKLSIWAMKNLNTDIIIHNIYTPNQMLTSRWWMGFLDPSSKQYYNVSEDKRQQLWEEVLWMYKKIDSMVGDVLENTSPDTYIVLSSDHGVIPLSYEVRLNNLFAKKGWLFFKYNKEKSIHEIDYSKTKVVYLKMNHIYINPNGLGEIYKKTYGKEYKTLRSQVITALKRLKNQNGEKPLEKIILRENAHFLDLPKDRVGDLIIANNVGYGWSESLSQDLSIFHEPIHTGYKQAILPKSHIGLLTPFIVFGPRVKKNTKLKNIINHVDQYPTIMSLLKQSIPDFVEGRILKEVFKNTQEQ